MAKKAKKAKAKKTKKAKGKSSPLARAAIPPEQFSSPHLLGNKFHDKADVEVRADSKSC